jgi:hypothetical protein
VNLNFLIQIMTHDGVLVDLIKQRDILRHDLLLVLLVKLLPLSHLVEVHDHVLLEILPNFFG